MAGLGEVRWITIDVADLDRGGAFWGPVLGVTAIDRSSDCLWMSRLPAATGHTPGPGGGPGVVLQRVDDVKTAKSRIHLDLKPHDPATVVAEVQRLGGRVLARVDEPGYALVVVADPDGNEMCLNLRSSDDSRRVPPRLEPLVEPRVKPRVLPCGERTFELGTRTFVMGIVNATPDSFSDGGVFLGADAAYAQAMDLLAGGADLVDIGGESTRPGAAAIDLTEELARVIPVIERLVAAGTRAISIDTRHAAVAAAALAAGASWVNDVSGLADPDLAPVAARADALVVMHNRLAGFAPVEDDVQYGDVVEDVAHELACLRDQAIAAGVRADRVLIDPGLGFGKTVAGNLDLMGAVGRLQPVAPVLLGPSRKRFLGAVAGIERAADRDAATIGACLVAAAQGCEFVRVHDARGVRQALAVYETMQSRHAR